MKNGGRLSEFPKGGGRRARSRAAFAGPYFSRKNGVSRCGAMLLEQNVGIQIDRARFLEENGGIQTGKAI